MSTVEELEKVADGIAGNEAGSLRSPEAQASYFIDKAKVEATLENTKALKELSKTIDTMAIGIIGELMSLKETLVTCLMREEPSPDISTEAVTSPKKEKRITK
jgi:hypothetical protein